MAFEYIVDAANDLDVWLYDVNRRAPDDFINVLNKACDLYRRVRQDDDFKYALSEASRSYIENQAIIGNMSSSSDYLDGLGNLYDFLRREKEALLSYRVTQRLADNLILRVEQLLSALPEFGDPARTYDLLQQAEQEICSLANKLANQRRLRNIMSVMVQVGTGLMGVTLIGVNSLSLPLMTPIGTAISASFGGILLDRSIPDLQAASRG